MPFQGDALVRRVLVGHALAQRAKEVSKPRAERGVAANRGLIESGKLRTQVGRVFRLAEALALGILVIGLVLLTGVFWGG